MKITRRNNQSPAETGTEKVPDSPEASDAVVNSSAKTSHSRTKVKLSQVRDRGSDDRPLDTEAFDTHPARQ